jgi:hypothetical protein
VGKKTSFLTSKERNFAESEKLRIKQKQFNERISAANQENLARLRALHQKTYENHIVLQQRLAANFVTQKNNIQQMIASNNIRQAQFNVAMSKTMGSLQALGRVAGATKWHKEQAERQRLEAAEAERQRQEEIARITEEHNRQVAEHQRQVEEVQRQVEEAQRKIIEHEAPLEAVRLYELQEAQRKAALTPEHRQAEEITEALKYSPSFAVRVAKQAEEAELSSAPLAPTGINHTAVESNRPERAVPKPERRQQALNIAEEALKKRLSLTPRANKPDGKIDSPVIHSGLVRTTQPVINESKEQEQTAEAPAHRPVATKPQVRQKSQKVVQEALKLRQSLVTAKSAKSEFKPDERNEALRQRDAFFSSQNQAVAIGAAAGLSGTASQVGSLAVHIKNAIAALGSTATASPAGAMVVTIVTGFYHAEAGKGSDKTPGGKNFIKAMPAAMLNLPTDEILREAAQEQRTIDAAIRGRLVLSNGEMQIQLLKTEQPSAIPVVAGVPDDKGNYQCTLPATDELPARTILVTPTNAPGTEGLGAVITLDHRPETITHTGNNAQPVSLPTVTTLPGFDSDLIVVPPLETGDKPIYVMLSSKGKSYEPNKGAVGNMGEFFKQTVFGEQAKNYSQKTSKIYQGQTVYKANNDVSQYLEKGDQFYLDGKHKNHLEVFNRESKFKYVLNLDGSININKTDKADGEGRILK